MGIFDGNPGLRQFFIKGSFIFDFKIDKVTRIGSYYKLKLMEDNWR